MYCGCLKKRVMTQTQKLPLDALQLASIRRSDKIPRNRGVLQLGCEWSAV